VNKIFHKFTLFTIQATPKTNFFGKIAIDLNGLVYNL